MVLTGLVGTTAVSFAAYSIAAPADGETMTPVEAYEAAATGDILFVDIRRPDEWQDTGVAEGAVPIDMRRDDFIDAVLAARQFDTQPIALICARGVRSRRVSALLNDAGITPIIDVTEGMLGSLSGPGYLRRDLPIRAWTPEN